MYVRNADSAKLIIKSEICLFNPFNPEFTIVIFIHYKPRIAVAILDLQWMKMTWCGLKIKENYHLLINQFHGNFRSKTLSCRKIKYIFRDVKWCFNESWGLKVLKENRNSFFEAENCVYNFQLQMHEKGKQTIKQQSGRVRY